MRDFMNEHLPDIQMDMGVWGGVVEREHVGRGHGRGLSYLNNNKASVLPERVLMAAVLYRALVDLESGSLVGSCGESPTKNRNQAINWFYSNKPKQKDYYTFIDICITLDLNPGAIRKQLIKKKLL